jgi:hypothetical protein
MRGGIGWVGRCGDRGRARRGGQGQIRGRLRRGSGEEDDIGTRRRNSRNNRGGGKKESIFMNFEIRGDYDAALMRQIYPVAFSVSVITDEHTRN